MEAMQPINLPFLLAIAGALATAIVLFLGVRSMTEQEKADSHRSEKLMFTRVGLQALTAALVIAAVALE